MAAWVAEMDQAAVLVAWVWGQVGPGPGSALAAPGCRVVLDRGPGLDRG